MKKGMVFLAVAGLMIGAPVEAQKEKSAEKSAKSASKKKRPAKPAAAKSNKKVTEKSGAIARTVKCKKGNFYAGEHDALCANYENKPMMHDCCTCIVARAHCRYEAHGGGEVKDAGECAIETLVAGMQEKGKTKDEVLNAISDIGKSIKTTYRQIKAKVKAGEIEADSAEAVAASLPLDLLKTVVKDEKRQIKEAW